MFCIKCGYEIPENGKFCPSCGSSQKNDNKYKFIKYKGAILFYILWCLIHVGLFIFSRPKGTYIYKLSDFDGGGSEIRHYDLSRGFYPFDQPLSSVLKGNYFWFDPIGNIDVYDFSELFFYTILLPFLIITGVFIWKKIRKTQRCTNK